MNSEPLRVKFIDSTNCKFSQRKRKPENARLVHWSVKGNSVCLSPFAHQSIKVEIKKKTALDEVLRRQTYKKVPRSSKVFL